MKSLPIIICSLWLVLLSNSIVAQGLEGEWQIKKSMVIGLLDTTVLFNQDSPDNVIDLSNISYHFSADGNYDGTDILGNPISGTWSTFASAVYIDEQVSSYEEINENEIVIYFNFQPFNKFAFAGFAGSYIIFVRGTPNNTSSTAGFIGASLTVSPNPFTDIAIAEFRTPLPLVNTRLEVFNAQGKQIHTVEGGSYSAGRHQLSFDLSHQPAGLYLLKLLADSGTVSAKVLKQ